MHTHTDACTHSTAHTHALPREARTWLSVPPDAGAVRAGACRRTVHNVTCGETQSDTQRNTQSPTSAQQCGSLHAPRSQHGTPVRTRTHVNRAQGSVHTRYLDSRTDTLCPRALRQRARVLSLLPKSRAAVSLRRPSRLLSPQLLPHQACRQGRRQQRHLVVLLLLLLLM
jgi:hypothetical protein